MATLAVLCSGEGSRMAESTRQRGVPKHLLSLWDENMTSRIVRQAWDFVDSTLCVVAPGRGDLFRAHLPGVHVVEKQAGAPFLSDLTVLTQHVADTSRIIVTTGDLVFDDDEARRAFALLAGDTHTRIIFGRESGLPIRLFGTSMTQLSRIVQTGTNPEKVSSVASTVLKIYLRDILFGRFRISRMKTLWNINREADYQAVLRNIWQIK
jgi:molybdopterin-guanine dinucleotide biosynthesis protein A